MLDPVQHRLPWANTKDFKLREKEIVYQQHRLSQGKASQPIWTTKTTQDAEAVE